MVNRVLTALTAVVFVIALSVPVLAQEKGQKPPAEPGKDMQKQEMKMEGMKMGSCDPACGFRVVSHDQSEIVDMLKLHAKKHHDKNLTDEEANKLIKDAPPKGMKGGPPPDAKPPKP